MKKYDSIERGIANEDIEALRESMGSICYTGPGFDEELKEVINYVVNVRGVNIMDDKLTGKLISSEKDTFSDDDFSDAVFDLKENFCKERVDDVILIGKYINRKSALGTMPVDSKTRANEEYSTSSAQNVGKLPNQESRPLNPVLAAAIVIVIILIVVLVLK